VDLQLRGRTALVVGGSRGIGWAIADALAREGAAVVIASRGASGDDAAARIAAQYGVTAAAVRIDTTNDESVRAGVRAAEERVGPVDILVNTAANPWSSDRNRPAIETPDHFVLDEVDMKVVGYLRTARAVAPGMIDRGWGRIINISGLGARMATTAAHTIRNVGVAALTKNLADELGRYGINVTVVHPGPTVTPAWADRVQVMAAGSGRTPEQVETAYVSQTAIGRLVDAGEVADVVAFLASPRSVAITGDAIAVGGGVKGPVYY
jgi:NAD(P)-dependent dehydrogenase (short-subunit alcohol dehydrogenase family)